MRRLHPVNVFYEPRIPAKTEVVFRGALFLDDERHLQPECASNVRKELRQRLRAAEIAFSRDPWGVLFHESGRAVLGTPSVKILIQGVKKQNASYLVKGAVRLSLPW